VQDDKQHDRPADRDEDAVEIEAADAFAADGGHDEAADHRADDADDNVEQESFTVPVDDQAGNETGDQPRARSTPKST